jgi:uncharacterized membrane protein YjfL (UPF0719 family)
MSGEFLLGLIFFIVAFSVSLIAICLCFTVVTRITRYHDIELIRANNQAVAVVIAASFIALAIMLKSAIYPSTALLQDYWFLENKVVADLVVALLRICGYIILTTLVSLFSIAAALFLFQKFTRQLDEEEEVRNGNMAVAILLAGVLISFALMMESGVSDFVNTLIPVKQLFKVGR